MNLSLPAFASSWSSSWASSYWSVIDLGYQVYTPRLLQFNIPGAFTSWSDISQAEWGIANTGSRHSQNNAWNSQYAQASVSWSSTLNVYSVTRNFTTSIKSINAAVIRFSIFDSNSSEKCLTLDDTNKRFSAVTNSGNAGSVVSNTQKPKWFIATNTNNFLIVCDGSTIKSIPCDVNGNIIAWTINTATYRSSCCVVAAIGQYVWIFWWDLGWGGWISWFNGQLYSVSSSWVLSTVWSNITLWNQGLWNNTVVNIYLSSYVKNNSWYLYWYVVNGNGAVSAEISGLVDLSNTSAFTWTTWHNLSGFPLSWWITSANMNVWFDWTKILVPTWSTIVSITSWGALTNEWYVPLTTWFMRFRNSLTKMSDKTLNFATNLANDNFNWKWRNLMSADSNMHTRVIFVYKLTWSNEEDTVSACTRVICKNATTYADWLNFNINGTSYGTDIIGDIGQMKVDTITPITPTNNIKFNINIMNSLSRTLKTWFGITGWTYSAPTWANNLSGDATNGWTFSAGWSYLDITL